MADKDRILMWTLFRIPSHSSQRQKKRAGSLSIQDKQYCDSICLKSIAASWVPISILYRMKLVIIGGTGLVATELIRQGLRASEITALVALARQPVQLDADAPNTTKFESMIVRDYAQFDDAAKAVLAGADACIWYVIRSYNRHTFHGTRFMRLTYILHRTVGITPGRARTYDFAEVKRVCQDCTIAGLEALRETNSAAQKPVRFVYLSGHGISQDFTTKPFVLGEYRTMRVSRAHLSRYYKTIQVNLTALTYPIARQGQTEKMVQDFGRDHKEVEVQIVRPGMVLSSINSWRALQASLIRASSYVTSAIANIERAELSAALLNQVIHGFEKQILSNEDLVRIGGSTMASST